MRKLRTPSGDRQPIHGRSQTSQHLAQTRESRWVDSFDLSCNGGDPNRNRIHLLLNHDEQGRMNRIQELVSQPLRHATGDEVPSWAQAAGQSANEIMVSIRMPMQGGRARRYGLGTEPNEMAGSLQAFQSLGADSVVVAPYISVVGPSPYRIFTICRPTSSSMST
ncbi:hypothetical protein C2W62_12880 [Candidatus Entotheonella serta]|nr:hypothetical protein C2W62_12880 [Candidatus Entotheonella serta]